MTAVLLFHHALGLTAGVQAFADELRAAGHEVVTPDLYDGAVYASLDDGVAHAEQVGMDAIIERGVPFADGLGDRLVVAGFSLGTLPAQKLAQTRPGVVGAILFAGGVPVSVFGDGWPAGVGLHVHVNEDDEWAELDVAEELVAAAGGELFVYPGGGHLVADSSWSDHDPYQAAQMMERALAFLDERRGDGP